MKKLFMALGLAALLAGCASHENNGMGGTTDDTMKTDSIQNSGSSTDQNINTGHDPVHRDNPDIMNP